MVGSPVEARAEEAAFHGVRGEGEGLRVGRGGLLRPADPREQVGAGGGEVRVVSEVRVGGEGVDLAEDLGGIGIREPAAGRRPVERDDR